MQIPRMYHFLSRIGRHFMVSKKVGFRPQLRLASRMMILKDTFKPHGMHVISYNRDFQ